MVKCKGRAQLEHHGGLAVRAGVGVDEPLGLGEVNSQGLFYEDVQAGLEAGQAQLDVRGVGRGDDGCVDHAAVEHRIDIVERLAAEFFGE
jgi:hypothetical protein